MGCGRNEQDVLQCGSQTNGIESSSVWDTGRKEQVGLKCGVFVENYP